ncbi:hypothetical protein [Chondromyces crocatus]|nr:hypothetical protein [Chondromyces crocatus]
MTLLLVSACSSTPDPPPAHPRTPWGSPWMPAGGTSFPASGAPGAATAPLASGSPGTSAGVVVPPRQREKVAVLPLDEDRLFRAERAELRQILAWRLATTAPDVEVLPLTEVDAKLRPVSPRTGARCAIGAPLHRTLQNLGWITTEVTVIHGIADMDRESDPRPDEEVWIRLLGAKGHVPNAFWAGRLNVALPLPDRYRAAFATLERKDEELALLGMLSARDRETGALREGSLRLCEPTGFGGCEPATAAWRDRLPELPICFSGQDDVVTEVLVSGDGPMPRCERTGLDAPEGTAGQQEACICRALSASSAMRVRPGRRIVALHHEARDLVGKPRPRLRVVEADDNLFSQTAWDSNRTIQGGKGTSHAVRHLEVAGLDALAAPLARCAAPPGSVFIADLELREDGSVSASRLVSGADGKQDAICIEAALQHGAFSCTDDGKAAQLRIAIAWPGTSPASPAPTGSSPKANVGTRP